MPKCGIDFNNLGDNMKQIDPLPTVVSGYHPPPPDARPGHIQDFTLVSSYYSCSNEEIMEMRELANTDQVAARESYAAMANEIRFWLRREDL